MKAITIIKVKNGFVSYEHEVKEYPALDQLSFHKHLGTSGYTDEDATGAVRMWYDGLGAGEEKE